MIRKVFRGFLGVNRWLSQIQKDAAARLFGRRNGGGDFRRRILPGLLKPGQRVLDVGGGKHPAIDLETKKRLALYVAGLDIDAGELEQAPEGAYDDIVVGDVAEVAIPGQYDLIISKAVLEHTQQNDRVIAQLSHALNLNGSMAHFIPCRYALFAQANLLIGNQVARCLLFFIHPHKRRSSGFKAYYDSCTPSAMSRLCQQNGLVIDRLQSYFSSDYCSFFAPLYTLDMIRQLLIRSLGVRDLCETFVIVATKPNPESTEENEDIARSAGSPLDVALHNAPEKSR